MAPSLIIAVEDMIQQLDLDNERSLQHQHLFRKTDMQKVIAIAYDSLYGDVYWSELGPVSTFIDNSISTILNISICSMQHKYCYRR